MVRLRFSRGTGIAAAAVRAYTWSWCAHVGFVLPSGCVLDATPDAGVAIRSVKFDRSDRFFDADVPEIALNFAKSQIGSRYDFRGVLGVAIHHDLYTFKRWYCDALVEWACWRAGRGLIRVDHLDRISPRDLLLSPLLTPVQMAA